MKNIIHKFVFIFVLVSGACQTKTETGAIREDNLTDSVPFRLNYKAIADMIIQRAMLKPGERVLLVAKPKLFDSLPLLLKTRIIDAKAEYLGVFSVTSDTPNEWQTEFTKTASAKDEDALGEYFQSVDLGIMLPGADTTHIPYAAMQQVLRRGSGRTIHFHWAGAYHMNGAVKARSLEVDELYQTALLETDYKKLSKSHNMFEAEARGKR